MSDPVGYGVAISHLRLNVRDRITNNEQWNDAVACSDHPIDHFGYFWP
jgi:hypothetical protein